MRAKRSRTFWFFYVAMFVTIAIGYFHATRARANEKLTVAVPVPTQGPQQQSTNQQQAQQQNALGGAASNQLNVDGGHTTAIGLSTTSPIPLWMQGPQLPPCWLPTKARSYFFGAFAASSGYKRDPECVKALEDQRAHELAMAQIESEKFEAAQAACSETSSREIVACASK
jgi:hypothetical protein